MNPLKKTIFPLARLFGRHFPETMVRMRYFLRFKKLLNLKNPQTLNEKILYLSLRTDTNLWSELSDKYAVRNFVKSKIGEDRLITLYGVWDDATSIDFDSLPDSFVLKTNHGCGEIIIVEDKKELDTKKVIEYFNKEIRKPYGEVEGCKHYTRIKPLIIAEKLLRNDPSLEAFSNTIIDYKCWCFNGKCKYIYTCLNRKGHKLESLIYDTEWNSHPEYQIFSENNSRAKEIPKPENLKDIINAAESLASDFPVVRIDLYSIQGKIYFGEMTFTSLGGMMNYFTPDFLEKTGAMINLNAK